MLVVLRSGKRVRGTPLDVFGLAKVRRIERAMIDEYIDAIDTLVERFDQIGAARCIQIAGLPDAVRGYETLKLRRAGAYRLELAEQLARLGDASTRR